MLKVLLICILLGALVYSVVEYTKEYIYDNIALKVTIEKESSIRFPAITICSQNPMMYSKVLDSRYVETRGIRSLLSEEATIASSSRAPHRKNYDLLNTSRYISKITRNELGYQFDELVSLCLYDQCEDLCNES